MRIFLLPGFIVHTLSNPDNCCRSVPGAVFPGAAVMRYPPTLHGAGSWSVHKERSYWSSLSDLSTFQRYDIIR